MEPCIDDFPDTSQLPIDTATNFVSDAMEIDETMQKLILFKQFFEERKKEIEVFHRWKSMVYLADPSVMYHGSKIANPTKVLYPMPSGVLNGESAVFATPDRTLALLFIADWTDNDLTVGYINGQLTVEERYKGAFQTIFLNKSGYLYLVSANTFQTDARLGMQSHEFISKESVPIIGSLFVPDLWVELQSLRAEIAFVEFVEPVIVTSTIVEMETESIPVMATTTVIEATEASNAVNVFQ